MSQQKASTSNTLNINPLIANLIEAGKGEPLAYLEGFVGPSGDELVCLYGNFNLTYFAEIPKGAIVYACEIPGDLEGRVRIFMSPETRIRLNSARGQKAGTILAKAVDVSDLDFCLVECALGPEDAYQKCAAVCYAKHPTKTGSERLFRGPL